jgi:hypothetical protein
MRKWLRYLWIAEDGFFGIGMGPSGDQKREFSDLSNLAGFATSRGEGDIATSDNFWKSILSGDPSKIAGVLAPETSAINEQAQQAKKTASEFHNRGGGTNAGMQMANDAVRSHYDKILANLTGSAAGALGASGHSLLGLGASAHEGAFGEASHIQQLKEAKIGDIFKSITEIAGSLFGGGGPLASLGKRGGSAATGAFQNMVQPELDTSYANDTLSLG